MTYKHTTQRRLLSTLTVPARSSVLQNAIMEQLLVIIQENDIPKY